MLVNESRNCFAKSFGPRPRRKLNLLSMYGASNKKGSIMIGDILLENYVQVRLLLYRHLILVKTRFFCTKFQKYRRLVFIELVSSNVSLLLCNYLYHENIFNLVTRQIQA